MLVFKMYILIHHNCSVMSKLRIPSSEMELLLNSINFINHWTKCLIFSSLCHIIYFTTPEVILKLENV